jgi:hypothetical protein
VNRNVSVLDPGMVDLPREGVEDLLREALHDKTIQLHWCDVSKVGYRGYFTDHHDDRVTFEWAFGEEINIT